MVLAAVGVFVFVRGRVNDHATHFEATFARLTTEPGIEEFPSLSPDGKWVVYQSGQGGKLNFYLQSVTGQTPINLTKDSMASDIMPAFSPDGERIAFRSSRQGGGIFVMGRTGESPRLVSADGLNPVWSPDGNEIAYGTTGVGNSPGIRVGNSQLWAVNVATDEKRLITKTGDAVQPSWSPHGYRKNSGTTRTGDGAVSICRAPELFRRRPPPCLRIDRYSIAGSEGRV
jgi:Tol biopolymer transport system component